MANEKGFTEQFVDYSDGRDNAPTMTVMVGVSGSGKSVLSRGWVNHGRGNVVRFNRDNIRAMLFVDVPWSHHNEELTRRYEQEGVKLALRMGRDVIVDDTNCVRRTRYGWEEIARDSRVKFRLVVMTTTLEECIERDSKREGKERVGEGVIRKQYKDLMEEHVTPRMYELIVPPRPVMDRESLRKGEFPLRLSDAGIVLCDVDGTLANHTKLDGTLIRSPFDEAKVLLDTPHEVVVNWVREIYASYNVIIVSGRHDSCGDDTVEWLKQYGVPFDYVLMRASGDNRGDYIIKKEILDELLNLLPKDKIAFVLDDRPQVVKMWRDNGLKVYPVAGTTLHREGCHYAVNPKEMKGQRRCPNCGALEEF